MHAFTYAWSIPVRLQRWRSHHLIRHSLKPRHATCIFMALYFIELELWPHKVLHCGNTIILTFSAPVTLPWPDEPLYMNLTHIPWRYTGCANMNFLQQGFQKLTSNRQTDRQTDRHNQSHIPCHTYWFRGYKGKQMQTHTHTCSLQAQMHMQQTWLLNASGINRWWRHKKALLTYLLTL